MDITQIKGIGKELSAYLSQFDDCFSRSGSRQNLRVYVNGQLSDLPRKSIEPIALAANMPPRTLQCFLSILPWDHQRLRDKIQWIVADEHAHPSAIGVVDDSGNPKEGMYTAGVQRQWCGNTGKNDNCMVGVHIAYVTGDFQCLLDSDVYLPKDWANDPVRRKKAHIPDDVIYRKSNEQAQINQSGALTNSAVNYLDETIAWKENRFRFRNARLKQIFKETARWYDMEVQFQEEVPDTYTVSMSRDVPLSKLLQFIEQSGGVHFKIEGKQVIVTR